MKRKNKIISFSDFKKNKLNENVEEFITSTVTEEDFIQDIDEWKNKAFINQEVILSKAREDNFKGDLKAVRSKKTGKTVLIYRPSINIGSMMTTATESAEGIESNYYIFVGEDQFDEYGEAEDGIEIGYSVMPIYMMEEDVDEHDNDRIAELKRETYDMEPIAKAKVKFWEGEDKTEVLEIVEGDKSIDINKIELLYPTL